MHGEQDGLHEAGTGVAGKLDHGLPHDGWLITHRDRNEGFGDTSGPHLHDDLLLSKTAETIVYNCVASAVTRKDYFAVKLAMN